MAETLMHEVIDYRASDGGGRVVHHFFDDAVAALAWIERFLPSVRPRLTYICRYWGPQGGDTKVFVEDHRGRAVGS